MAIFTYIWRFLYEYIQDKLAITNFASNWRSLTTSNRVNGILGSNRHENAFNLGYNAISLDIISVYESGITPHA